MPEPLSIAVVTGSLSRRAGGLFHSVRRSALAFTEAGHIVTVIGLADPDTAADFAAWQPLEPIIARPRGPAALGYAPEVGKALRAKHFDVVHQHGIWQAFSGEVSAWRRRTGGPVMISPRGMLDPWAVRHHGWKKRLAAALYERANLAEAACLHALNASEVEAMRGFGLKNPIAVIPNGTDPPQDGFAPPRPVWWPNGKVLLFLGRIHPKKGVRELIEAWAHVAREAPAVAAAWHIVIAGWDDGGHVPALRQAIARHGLEHQIMLPGPLYGGAKSAALLHADAFVLPSYSEGLPMSILEAWAHRLPVLMTEACNLPEGFAAGAARRISIDPQALAADLVTALGDKNLARMGEAGHRLTADRFGWNKIAHRHVEVYRWMLSGGTDPGSVPVGVILS